MRVLETERLVLRWLAPETDAEFIFELLNEPEWLRFIGDRDVRTLDDARAYIVGGPVAMYHLHGFGLYAVERKDDGVALGICGLVRRDTLDDADLGFAFLRRYRGQGYAYEAAAATLAHARDVLGLQRVAAITSPDNDDSKKLLVRLGFAHQASLRLGHETQASDLYAWQA
jgi:RimJ/RimL family protein N-acetyltransferase